MTVCNPVLKLVAAEIIASLSARSMQAAFERILEIFPVAIRKVQVDNELGFQGKFKQRL